MSDPRDYGDIYPSDADDVSPGDRVNNYSEVDYEVEKLIPKPIETQFERDTVPNPATEPRIKENRFAVMGIILSFLEWRVINGSNFAFYNVGAQDGRIIEAYAPFKGTDTRYTAGTPVTLIKDHSPTGWAIVGDEVPDELPTLTLYPTNTQVGLQFDVNFDAVLTDTPIDDTFGIPSHFVLDSGGIKVDTHQCLVQVDFNVTVQATNPITEGLDRLFFQRGCWRPGELMPINNLEVMSPKLWFNQQNGFQLDWDTTDCTLNLSIGSDTVKDSILNQQSTSNPAFWTDSPELGGNLWIGRQMTRGWFTIGPEGQQFYIKQTTGFGQLKFQWPAGPPSQAGAFLIAEAVSGECVKAGWRNPGASHTLCVQSCEIYGYNYCYINTYYGTAWCSYPVYRQKYYTFTDGLLTSGTDVQTPTPQPTPTQCQEEQPNDADPCGYE